MADGWACGWYRYRLGRFVVVDLILLPVGTVAVRILVSGQFYVYV